MSSIFRVKYVNAVRGKAQIMVITICLQLLDISYESNIKKNFETYF
jgi:hypothetical protein